MSTFPKYDRYKDSGVEWLGDIPNGWETARAGHIFEKVERPPSKADGIVTAYRDGQVTLRSIRRAEGYMVALLEQGYQGVRVGDLVIHGMDAFAGTIGLSEADGKCTPEYVILEPRTGEISNSYYSRLLRYMAETGYIYLICPSVRERAPRFRFPKLKNEFLPVPPKLEQDRIVTFLDRKTAEIDTLIAKKQRQIELLDEQKAILINHAVTRGLNPSAKLKPSGIEWIQKIPKHWSECRLKGSLQEVDNRTQDGTETLLSLRTKLGLVPHDDVSDIQITDQQLVGYKIVEPGELVMNRMRAAFGIFAISQRHGLVSPDYAVFRRVANYDLRYLLRLFRTQSLMTEFRRFSKGLGTGESGFLRLYTDRFYRVVCPTPPLQEQEAIVEYIDQVEAQSDLSQAAIRKQIKCHKILRSTLIAHAVTGRVKV